MCLSRYNKKLKFRLLLQLPPIIVSYNFVLSAVRKETSIKTFKNSYLTNLSLLNPRMENGASFWSVLVWKNWKQKNGIIMIWNILFAKKVSIKSK